MNLSYLLQAWLERNATYECGVCGDAIPLALECICQRDVVKVSTFGELKYVLATYHADRVKPCIQSEVTDLAVEYGVSAQHVCAAIGELLGEEFGADRIESVQ